MSSNSLISFFFPQNHLPTISKALLGSEERQVWDWKNKGRLTEIFRNLRVIIFLSFSKLSLSFPSNHQWKVHAMHFYMNYIKCCAIPVGIGKGQPEWREKHTRVSEGRKVNPGWTGCWDHAVHSRERKLVKVTLMQSKWEYISSTLIRWKGQDGWVDDIGSFHNKYNLLIKIIAIVIRWQSDDIKIVLIMWSGMRPLTFKGTIPTCKT